MAQRMLLPSFDEDMRSRLMVEAAKVMSDRLACSQRATVQSTPASAIYIPKKFRAISLCNVYSLVLPPWGNWGVEGLIKWALKTINGLGAGRGRG